MNMNSKNVILPTNVGQQVKFPGTSNVCLAREFSVNADGSVRISPWLTSQVRRHCPESRDMTGSQFINRAVAWFTGERVKHNLAKRRTPRKPIGLVNVGMEMEAQLAHAGIRI